MIKELQYFYEGTVKRLAILLNKIAYIKVLNDYLFMRLGRMQMKIELKRLVA